MPKDQLSVLKKKFTYWKTDWKSFIKEQFKVSQTWKLQDDLLATIPTAIKEHKPIYIASGHALGKDYICGAIAPAFLHLYQPSIVILTAPTDRQVNGIMFKEVSTHWRNRKFDFGGKIFSEPHIEIEKDWYLLGFTTKDTGQGAEAGGGKFQGFHSPNICIIVSEAQAVENPIRDQIDAIATASNCLLIFIGNPTASSGWFADGLKNRNGKNIVFHFSCLENPNYIERKEVIPGLTSYEWVEDKRVRWGEHDPRWISRVLGQVPDVSLNRVFDEALLDKIGHLWGTFGKYANIGGVSVDPSGRGVDENVFMSGEGGEPTEVFTKLIMSPSEKAHTAVKMCRAIPENRGKFIIVDCDGLGQETFTELKDFHESYTRGIELIAFNGSAPCSLDGQGKRTYRNKRCEAAFIGKDRAIAGKSSINPRDTELKEDLLADEFFVKNGMLQLIDKEDVKDKIGRSPGRGDAWKMLQYAFSFYQETRISNILSEKEIKDKPVYAVGFGSTVDEKDLVYSAGMG